MRERLRIGLTGGIASGKSTASRRFEELGVPVIDADVASRAVVQPGTPGLAAIVDRFGAGILVADGNLNRPKMRDLIFNDPASRRDLDAIVHPLIRDYMAERAVNAPGPYIILAIPLLVEGGREHDRVDRVLLIDIDEAVQLERLRARDGSSAEQAHAILASQASRSARLAVADDVLLNGGSVANLRQAVDLLHERYLRLAKG
jgi:dephospho-CoA kinase